MQLPRLDDAEPEQNPRRSDDAEKRRQSGAQVQHPHLYAPEKKHRHKEQKTDLSESPHGKEEEYQIHLLT